MAIGMFSIDDQMAIENQLKDYMEKSESFWAAIVDKGGNLFVQYGDTGNLDLSILCALAAGSFAATQELAKRLGESEFNALYQEGLGMSILMSSLYHDTLLLTVFGEKTNIGLVRFYCHQVTEQLNRSLKEINERNDGSETLLIETDVDHPGSIFS